MAIYTVDVLNSKVAFSVRYLEFAKVRGHFTSFTCTIQTVNEKDILDNDVEIDIVIEVGSINTNEPSRDQHLISADFFHADLFPKIYFKKTNIEKMDATHFKLYGELQIKNITNNIIFDVEAKTIEVNEPSLYNTIFYCKSKINRFDFNLVYGSSLENSPFFISKDIEVEVSFQLHSQ